MGEDGSFPDHSTHLNLLRHKLAVTTVHTVQPKWHPMAVSLYKFTEDVITCLILLLMVTSFLSWFIYFFLFLTGRPPAATSIIVTLVTACSNLKRLTTKAKATGTIQKHSEIHESELLQPLSVTHMLWFTQERTRTAAWVRVSNYVKFKTRNLPRVLI